MAEDRGDGSSRGLEEPRAGTVELSSAALETIAELVAAKINPLHTASASGAGTKKDDVPIRVLPSGAGREVSVDTLVTEGIADGNGKEKEKEKNELVFIGEGLPPITAKAVEKIERGDYVDFRDLLPQKPSPEDTTLTDLEEQGIVVVSSTKQVRPRKKQIQDLATWMEAFLVFVAVKTRKKPELMVDLMAYGALIARGARDYRGSGWLSYDFQFRRVAAARGSATKWGEKDVSLWEETVSRSEWPTTNVTEERKGQKRKATDQGGKKMPKGKAPWKSAVCFPFSYTGKCTREGCEFLHVCFECGEGHSQLACPKKQPTQ